MGGNDIGQLTTSAIQSVFGMNFGSANQSVSGGGNPLQTGVQTPRGYSNTVNRSVIDASFNSIIGNNKVPSNIFANPVLGIDARAQSSQVAAVNQSSSILLTQLAQSSAGLAVLSQVPSTNSILSLIKSGHGLVSQIQGASQLLAKVSNIPGAADLLKNIPGASDILSNINFSATALEVPIDLNSLDVSAFELPPDLQSGADQVLTDASPVAEKAFSEIASFW